MDAEPTGCTERRDRLSVDSRTSLARRRWAGTDRGRM